MDDPFDPAIGVNNIWAVSRVNPAVDFTRSDIDPVVVGPIANDAFEIVDQPPPAPPPTGPSGGQAASIKATGITDAFASLLGTDSAGTWGQGLYPARSSTSAANHPSAADHMLAPHDVELFFWALGQDRLEEGRALDFPFAGTRNRRFGQDPARDALFSFEPDLVSV